MDKKVKDMSAEDFLREYNEQFEFIKKDRLLFIPKPSEEDVEEARTRAYNFFLDEDGIEGFPKKERVVWTVGRILSEAKHSNDSLKDTFEWYNENCKDEAD